jgi:hypothetical protein
MAHISSRSSSWASKISRRMRLYWRGRGNASVIVWCGVVLAVSNITGWLSLHCWAYDWPATYVFAARIVLPIALLVCTSWVVVVAWRVADRSERLGNRKRSIGFAVLSGLPPAFLLMLLVELMLRWRVVLDELAMTGFPLSFWPPS